MTAHLLFVCFGSKRTDVEIFCGTIAKLFVLSGKNNYLYSCGSTGINFKICQLLFLIVFLPPFENWFYGLKKERLKKRKSVLFWTLVCGGTNFPDLHFMFFLRKVTGI